MINESHKQSLQALVSDIEQRTDAEIVVVVARQSDSYNYVSTLWAALFTLLTPFVLHLSPWALSFQQTALVQMGVFAVIALGLRYPPFLSRLIPRHIRLWRAANMARRQFLENNLHYTRQQTGVLIFVSLLEHYAEIIADRGIDQHVPQSLWRNTVDNLIAEIRQGRMVEGLHKSIETCGELLIRHAPATSQKNELPDHVVLL